MGKLAPKKLLVWETSSLRLPHIFECRMIRRYYAVQLKDLMFNQKIKKAKVLDGGKIRGKWGIPTMKVV